MGNIAAYQEGYTDGFDRGMKNKKNVIIRMLKEFYNDNYETDIEDPFIRGYNLALDHLIELVNDIEAMED